MPTSELASFAESSRLQSALRKKVKAHLMTVGSEEANALRRLGAQSKLARKVAAKQTEAQRPSMAVNSVATVHRRSTSAIKRRLSGTAEKAVAMVATVAKKLRPRRRSSKGSS